MHKICSDLITTEKITAKRIIVLRKNRKGLGGCGSFYFDVLVSYHRLQLCVSDSFTIFFRSFHSHCENHANTHGPSDVILTLCGSLSIIKKQSLCTGIFPNRLCTKKDDNQLFENYRSISLLSSLSKVFEKIVFDHLYDDLITNGLLFESQYGFWKQHSTVLAALELTDRIPREMDQNRIPFSVFLDLSKAFDTLNYHILFSTLEYYGIRSTTL